jgi:hypothetical protein
MLPRSRSLEDVEAEITAVHAEIAFEQDRTMAMATEHFIDRLNAGDDGAVEALRDLVFIGVRNEVIRRRLEGEGA